MTTTNENLLDQFAAVAANIGFELCLISEGETVKAIKALRAGFVETYEETFPGSGLQAHEVAKAILTAALMQRHELEQYGSPLLSRSIH